jgi:beta-catenin-like protein 1
VVDFGGLGTVFALFMGKLKPKSKKGRAKRNEATLAEEEERCLSVVCNLIRGVRGSERRARVAAKFVENEFEKCDRLMEILVRYESRVAAVENEQLDHSNVSEEDLLLERLDAGLFTLQQACLVAAELWALRDVGLRRRILALLHQRGHTLAVLRSVLLEYRATIGDNNDPDETISTQVERATNLLEALGFKEEEEMMKDETGAEGSAKRPAEEGIPEEDERERQRMRLSE